MRLQHLSSYPIPPLHAVRLDHRVIECAALLLGRVDTG